ETVPCSKKTAHTKVWAVLNKTGNRTREGLSDKKTVRWTVFSEERRGGTDCEAMGDTAVSTPPQASGRRNRTLLQENRSHKSVGGFDYIIKTLYTANP
ncbi:MAG: hypothetical protein MJ168_02070, partial [Clostridia bacterium]|nr:hypothetical protein [Clostridia bacterium]